MSHTPGLIICVVHEFAVAYKRLAQVALWVEVEAEWETELPTHGAV